MNTKENLEIVKKGYKAFGSKNIPALLDLFSNNIEWRSPEVEGSPLRGTCDGRKEVETFFATLEKTEAFSEFEPREFIAEKDKVVVLGTSTAKVIPTGRTFKTEWMHLFTVKDGKITHFKEMFDTAKVATAYHKAASA